MNTNKFRRAMKLLALLSFLGGLGIGFYGISCVPWNRAMDQAVWTHLDAHGVIDHDKLTEALGEDRASNPAFVPDHLFRRGVDAATNALFLVALFLLVHGVALVILCANYTRQFELTMSRIAAGHCPKCNYDMTGNVDGCCSECGEELLSALLSRK